MRFTRSLNSVAADRSHAHDARLQNFKPVSAQYIEAVVSGLQEAGSSRLEPGTRTCLLALEMNLAAHLAEYLLAAPEERPALLPSLTRKAEKLGLDCAATRAVSEHIITLWRDWARLIDVTIPDTRALFEQEAALQE